MLFYIITIIIVTMVMMVIMYRGPQRSLRKQKSKPRFKIQKHISKFENTFQNSKTHFKNRKHISKFKTYFKTRKQISKIENTLQNSKTYFKIRKHISKFENTFQFPRNTFVPGPCQFFVVKKERLPLPHAFLPCFA